MTMELIQHIELGSQQNSIEFTSISSSYTDLMILFSGRTTSTGTGPGLEIAFNGSTSNFSTISLQGSGSSAVGFSTSTAYAGVLNANNTTSSTFNNIRIYIPNYASSAHKSFQVDSVSEANATAAYQDIIAGLWSQTAAITSIRLRQSASFDLVAGSSATLYGIKRFNTTLSPKATGGAISYDSVNNKWVHAFYTSGTFTPTENLTGVEYLVIAGGGGGGSGHANGQAGGGGAGGYRSSVVGESSGGGASAESTLSLTSGTGYTVTIGAGGSPGTPGTNGSNSVFGSITATGGGRGGTTNGDAGASGGSGGGSYGGSTGTTAGGAGTANQGYAGGSGRTDNATYRNSGGGGGAGAVGQTLAVGVFGAGAGGAGVSSSITGTAVTRAGGGGAGWDGGGAAGGAGGGGNGATNTNAQAGVANTGGGGGGGSLSAYAGGNGGSGVVFIRYSA